MWWVKVLEVADAHGIGTGRYRLTARSDEGGGGPFGDTSHDHASRRTAESCDRCRAFCRSLTGMDIDKNVEGREIIVNGRKMISYADDLDYSEIVGLLGYRNTAVVTVAWCFGQESGTLTSGGRITVRDGLIINVANTIFG